MSAPFLELATNVSDWWRLPLKLRQRWWSETDFGKLEPNDELKAAVRAALGKENFMSDNGNDKPAPEPAKPAEAPPAEDKPPVEEPAPKEDAAA